MMRRIKLILAATAFAATALLAAAAPGIHAEPTITEVEVQAPDAITVGDRFHLIIRAEAVEGADLSISPGSLPFEFEVTNTPDPTTRSLGNDRIEVTFDLEIAVFVPGDVPIPPIPIDYSEPGGETGSVLTPASLIIVNSVLPVGEPLNPKPLKPQLEIGTASSIGVLVAALAAVLAALAIVLFLIYRSMRPKPVPALVLTADMGPEDRARAILEAAGVAFARDRDFVAYYGVIAVTIRNYLTERYGFHAFALTTRELSAEMGRRGIDRWQARLVNGLLTQCDAAVYARYTPALDRADLDLTASFEIVEMSRPKPVVEAPEPEAVGVR